MEFREGMLGVVIVALALTGAFFVSYLSGIETTEQEVTKYDYLADVSGLFDYDKSPQYIEFDPSTNYTGYYSTTSEGYFPENDVGYESLRSGNANNYKLNLKPISISSGDVILSDYSGINPFPDVDDVEIRFLTTGMDNGYLPTLSETHVTLASYIKAMNLDPSVNYIEFKSAGMYDDSKDNDESYDAPFVLFTTKGMYEYLEIDIIISKHTAYLGYVATEQWFIEHNATPPYDWYWAMEWGSDDSIIQTWYHEVNLACLSCSVDLNTGIVTLYYDNDCERPYNTTYLDDVILSYGGASSILANALILDDTAEINTFNLKREYLDPAYGVVMKDAGA